MPFPAQTRCASRHPSGVRGAPCGRKTEWTLSTGRPRWPSGCPGEAEWERTVWWGGLKLLRCLLRQWSECVYTREQCSVVTNVYSEVRAFQPPREPTAHHSCDSTLEHSLSADHFGHVQSQSKPVDVTNTDYSPVHVTSFWLSTCSHLKCMPNTKPVKERRTSSLRRCVMATGWHDKHFVTWKNRLWAGTCSLASGFKVQIYTRLHSIWNVSSVRICVTILLYSCFFLWRIESHFWLV